MGCAGSKKEREFSSDIDRRVVEMLKQIKEKRLRSSNKSVEAEGKTDFKSFDKMVLSFPKIRRAFMRIKNVFNRFDKDGNGTIDTQELGDCLHQLGAKLMDDEVKQMFAEADMKGTGALNFNEFLLFLCIGAVLQLLPHLESVDVTDDAGAGGGADEGKGDDGEGDAKVKILEGGKELVEAIRIAVEAYLLFDADANGTIDREEVLAIITDGGGTKVAKSKRRGSNSNAGGSNALLSKERWSEMDWDKDGTITFKEFLWALLGWVGMNDDEGEDE